MPAIPVSSRAQIAAWTAAQAAAAQLAILSSATATEAWAYDPGSAAAGSDGFVIVPSDAPDSGRWTRQSDYVATALALDKLASTPAAAVAPGAVGSDQLAPELQVLLDMASEAEAIADLKSATADLEQAADELSLTNIEAVFGAAADKQEIKQHLQAKVGELSASVDQQLLAISNATDALAGQQATFTASLAGKADGSALTAALTRITTSENNITVLSGQYTSLSSTVSGKADASALGSLVTRVTTDEGNITSLSGEYTTLSSTVSGKADAQALLALVTRTATAEGNISTLSGQYSTLSTTVGSNTTSINQIAQSLNGVAANWSVSINTNGVINGVVRLDGGSSGSHFDVSADAFRVWQTGGAIPAFIIENNQAVFNVPLKANSVVSGQIASGLSTLNSYVSSQLTSWWPMLSERPANTPSIPSEKYSLADGAITAISTASETPFTVVATSAAIIMEYHCTYKPQTSQQANVMAGFMRWNTTTLKYEYMDEATCLVSTGSNAIYNTIIARCRIPVGSYTKALPWLYNISGNTISVRSDYVDIFQIAK